MSDLTDAQARALASPTRRAILAHLADVDRPVAVGELSDEFGMHHNGVRKHLDQLVAAGLVVEEREARATPGRPRQLYRLAPDSPAGNEQQYRRLAVLLATALATGEDPAVVGRRAATPTPAAVVRPVDALAARFAADVFAPVIRRRRGRRVDIVLHHCPFADAALANPAAVCRLHLGMAEGAAASIGGLQVDGLTPKDPRRAGCQVTLTETGDNHPGSGRAP